MSWDLIILNSTEPVDFEKENWKDFESTEYVANRIKKTFPESTWNDFSWGILETKFADIEFNIGNENDFGNNFLIHVRGGINPLGEIVRMCKENNWIAYDMSKESFVDFDNPNSDGFEKWKKFRNATFEENVKSKKPWWKF
jgi:hypothetical protein